MNIVKGAIQSIVSGCINMIGVDRVLFLRTIFFILFRHGNPNMYGRLPNKILLYETLYDTKTGGWVRLGDKTFRDYGSVELEVGRLWYAFTQLLQPRLVLETGTYKGYSTCCIAAALRDINDDGHIYTIDPQKKDWLWENTDIEPFITQILDYSQQASTADVLKDKIFDMLVIDSEHDYKTVMQELIIFEKQLKIGGVILMHDALYFDGVGAAIKQLYMNPRFEVITLDSPRNHGKPNARCPGITLVKKISDGEPELNYEQAFHEWRVGDVTSTPYLYRR